MFVSILLGLFGGWITLILVCRWVQWSFLAWLLEVPLSLGDFFIYLAMESGKTIMWFLPPLRWLPEIFRFDPLEFAGYLTFLYCFWSLFYWILGPPGPWASISWLLYLALLVLGRMGLFRDLPQYHTLSHYHT